MNNSLFDLSSDNLEAMREELLRYAFHLRFQGVNRFLDEVDFGNPLAFCFLYNVR